MWLSADQITFRVRVIQLGAVVTMLMAGACLPSIVLAAEQPHRWLIVAIMAAAAVDGVVIFRLPLRKLVASRWNEPFLMVWHLMHVSAISTVAVLDGGIHSPFVAMLFATVVFAALSLPRPRLVAITAVDISALFVIAQFGDSEGALGQVAVWAPTMLGVALIGNTISAELHRRVDAFEDAKEETVKRLARAVELRDIATGGHIDRMATYAAILADALGLPEHERDLIERASPMHDVGKIAVPDEILLKPGALTAEERADMERHAQVGHDLLAGSNSDLLETGATIALTHHERWDGAGYPNGLRGEDIPLPGRIVAIADVFDALTSDRVYRPAMPLAKAIDIIVDGRGAHFDPAVVDAFITSLDRIRALMPAPASVALAPEPAHAVA